MMVQRLNMWVAAVVLLAALATAHGLDDSLCSERRMLKNLTAEICSAADAEFVADLTDAADGKALPAPRLMQAICYAGHTNVCGQYMGLWLESFRNCSAAIRAADPDYNRAAVVLRCPPAPELSEKNF